MRFAILMAHWLDYGEAWSTPISLINELVARNHEVDIFNLYHNNGQLHPTKKIRHYSNDGFNKLYTEYRHGYKPDVIMVMDYGPWQCTYLNKQVFPDCILIKEAGDSPQSHRMHLQTAHLFDLVLCPDWQCVLDYQKRNINAVWMTHFADERIFNKDYQVEAVFDVVSTMGGRKYSEEIKKILGDRFNNERYFFGEEHAKRLLMGKIVLQNSQYGEITRRIFEGAAVGKMVLTDRLPLETRLHELLIEDQDIVYYNDAQDAINKINYYISHDQDRERIALNGYNKVMTEHSVKARVDQFEGLIHDLL